MQKCIRFIVVFAIVITGLSLDSPQTRKMADRYEYDEKAEIESINSKIEYFLKKENADSLLDFYNREIIYLPEYKNAIFGVNDLKKFFMDWFKAVNIKTYKKNIYEVKVLSNYILEIGYFSLSYSTKLISENEYKGKYMTMWKRRIEGKLNILSEAFGSDKNINPEDVPYKNVEMKENKILEKIN